MIIWKSPIPKFFGELPFFRGKLFWSFRLNRLVRLARKFIPTVNIPDEYDEFLYQSIIYTLFYANYVSVSLILNQEKLSIGFDYVDTKQMIRSIVERLITQKYIMTDPKRLAKMFLYWGTIEDKKYNSSFDELEKSISQSLALDMAFKGRFSFWSNERETEYNEFVTMWETLVEPKQAAKKARSWSGHSLAEMAKITGTYDLYKLTYKETSWYTHGLLSVSDFFLKDFGEYFKYSSSTSNLQKIECYLQAAKLFLQSFVSTNEVLGWGLEKKLKELEKEEVSRLAWIREFFRLHVF